MRLENVRMGRLQPQQGIAADVCFVICCAVISESAEKKKPAKTTYDSQITLVWGIETALVTSKALLEVASEPTLTSARLSTVRARYRQVAILLMLM